MFFLKKHHLNPTECHPHTFQRDESAKPSNYLEGGSVKMQSKQMHTHTQVAHAYGRGSALGQES